MIENLSNERKRLNRFVFLILPVLVLALTLATTGCEPNIGKSAEDGSFKVTVRDGLITDLGHLYLGVTIKNIGPSAQLHSFEAHLLGGDGELEIESFSLATKLKPDGKLSWDIWFRDLLEKDFPMDTEVSLVVFAEDSQSNSFSVEFTLPPLDTL